MANKLGNKDIKEKYFGTKKIIKEVVNGIEVYTSGKPLLNKFSWAQIREICENGDAANYWALGDIKTDYGNDGFARGFQLVDVHGTNTVNKHAIFMSVPVDKIKRWWTGSDPDDDGCKNNYPQSYIANYLWSFLFNDGYYSNELTDEIAANYTLINTPTNSVNDRITQLQCYLYLPSARELWPEDNPPGGLTGEEASRLHSFDFFEEYSEINFSVLSKYNLTRQGPQTWWTRSPNGNHPNDEFAKRSVFAISQNPNVHNTLATSTDNMYYICPCFAF